MEFKEGDSILIPTVIKGTQAENYRVVDDMGAGWVIASQRIDKSAIKIPESYADVCEERGVMIRREYSNAVIYTPQEGPCVVYGQDTHTDHRIQCIDDSILGLLYLKELILKGEK